ncbi:MAG TPA: hypothetical protein VJ044_05870, partial [Candidatus Hodarchaeales archaeon]|nr:hypothetical protein [Candidatus Hodarchaeales archaeon]
MTTMKLNKDRSLLLICLVLITCLQGISAQGGGKSFQSEWAADTIPSGKWVTAGPSTESPPEDSGFRVTTEGVGFGEYGYKFY